MNDFSPGDVIEIKTDKGLAYVQVTHDHPSYPPVIRAFKGTHEKRPSDLSWLVSAEPQFIAMIPLKGALKKLGVEFELAGRAEIPDALRKFPTFRMPIRNKAGEIVYWWFWDGQGLNFDVELDAEQSKLPLREVMSAERFLALLEEDA